MPRHDWRDDDVMSRERPYRDYEDRDRGSFFGGDRDELRMRRREGGLLHDESSGGRMRERPDQRGERNFGPDDERSEIPRDETERLIASNKVEGTPVYDRNGERLGTIHNFMVDKFRGKVVYAVLKHSSGFLGLDDRYYPLDWDQLTFDTRLGGYRINMTEDDLKGFGSWDRNERWSGRNRSSPERGDFDRDRDYRRERSMRDRAYDRGGGIRERW
jgi:sporulation protein YlmC with PRC-barrel domain